MPVQPPVTLSQVRMSNERIDPSSCPRTAVLVGATSGIGQAALQELVLATRKDGCAARIYIVGRTESAVRVHESLERLLVQNPHVHFVWVAGDVSLLAEVRRVCAEIRQREDSLDLLFLSAGYAPLGGREETEEGLIISQSLGHYSRILFIQHLLPLLKASPTQGRVVSILGAGFESTRIDLNDLNLEKPGSFGRFKCLAHTVTMLTAAMEQLAEANADVAFIHAHPGLVNTGNLNRGWRGRWLLQALANVVLAPAFWLAAMSIKESAQRTLYLITSAKYGGHGVPLGESVPPGLTTRGKETGGLFLVDQRGATVANDKVLSELRKGAKGRIWAKTTEVLQPYL